LGKLSRQALLDLALTWLDDQNIESFPPYLQREDNNNPDDEEALPYPAAKTVEEARQAYEDLQERKGGKREVLERILEGDWRDGITLRQLAMADLRYMDDHPASLRWTALELSRIDARQKESSEDWSSNIPRIQAATFVKALQQEIASLVKAHYHLSRSSTLPITFLRILILDSPYQTPRQTPEVFADSSRVIYVAFPDSCPYIYTSITASSGSKTPAPSSSIATDPRSLQRLVRDAVPKALSRPQERYTVKATALAAKNLLTLLALRGPGRSAAANGSYSIFADAALEGSPLDPRPSNTVPAEEHMRAGHKPSNFDDKENGNVEESQVSATTSRKRVSGIDPATLSPTSKKRRLTVESRFGSAGSSLTPAPLDRLDVRLLDLPAGIEDDGVNRLAGPVPPVSLSFAGTDVIGGIRKLAELCVIDPERMPSWMTGEEAVSMAVVRRGRRIKKAE
jgi:central kinetochore subunit Mis15/CHL4